MWLGHSAYLEISDGGTIDFDGAQRRVDDGHGHIAVDEIRMSNRPAPRAQTRPTPERTTAAAVDLSAVIAELKKAGRAPARRSAGGGH